MLNKSVVNHLNLISQLKALDGDNRWSIKAFETAAETVASLPQDVDGYVLTDLPGIGSKISSIISEFLDSGTSGLLEDLSSRWNTEMLTMTTVDGIGAKTALKLYKQGYQNFEQLLAAAKAGTLDSKLTPKVILASYKQQGRFAYDQAKQIGDYFTDKLKNVPGVQAVEVGGSLRRKLESVKDVDILACVEKESDRAVVMEAFKSSGPTTFQGKETKASIQFPVSADRIIQVDLWLGDASYWGSLLNHVTGSKDFNIATRTLAQSRGLSISEYGIFDADGKQIGGAKETDMFDILGLPYIEPEKRTGELPS